MEEKDGEQEQDLLLTCLQHPIRHQTAQQEWLNMPSKQLQESKGSGEPAAIPVSCKGWGCWGAR